MHEFGPSKRGQRGEFCCIFKLLSLWGFGRKIFERNVNQQFSANSSGQKVKSFCFLLDVKMFLFWCNIFLLRIHEKDRLHSAQHAMLKNRKPKQQSHCLIRKYPSCILERTTFLVNTLSGKHGNHSLSICSKMSQKSSESFWFCTFFEKSVLGLVKYYHSSFEISHQKFFSNPLKKKHSQHFLEIDFKNQQEVLSDQTTTLIFIVFENWS